MEQTLLAERLGRHVIFVRYRDGDTEHREWVYNLADIDAAPVIWAHDRGPEETSDSCSTTPGDHFGFSNPIRR